MIDDEIADKTLSPTTMESFVVEVRTKEMQKLQNDHLKLCGVELL